MSMPISGNSFTNQWSEVVYTPTDTISLPDDTPITSNWSEDLAVEPKPVRSEAKPDTIVISQGEASALSLDIVAKESSLEEAPSDLDVDELTIIINELEAAIDERSEAITGFYKDLLGREPDADGLKFYIDGGLPLDEVRAQIADSPEALAHQAAS